MGFEPVDELVFKKVGLTFCSLKKFVALFMFNLGKVIIIESSKLAIMNPKILVPRF